MSGDRPHVEVTDPFVVLPEALLYDPDLSHAAVRVYAVLLRHGSNPTNCYPSHARIAAKIGASARSVPAWIRELEDAGWVHRHPRTSEHGDHDSNGYTVHTRPRKGRAVERGVRAPQRGGSTPDNAGGARPTARLKKASEREPLNDPPGGTTADAAAPLPGLDDPQVASQPVDDTKAREGVAWKLIRAAYDARSRKPIENRKHVARTVVRLLEAGWTEEQVKGGLDRSPAWTPTSLQVELARGGSQPAGRPANRVPTDDPRRQGESRVVNVGEEMRRARR